MYKFGFLLWSDGVVLSPTLSIEIYIINIFRREIDVMIEYLNADGLVDYTLGVEYDSYSYMRANLV